MSHPGTVTPVPLRAPALAATAQGELADGQMPSVFHKAGPTVLVSLIAVCIVTDLISDIRHGEPIVHMVGMIIGTFLSFSCLALMWWLVRRSRRQAQALVVALDARRADVMEWRSKAAGTLQGLGALIDRQFETWGLSPAEREVGILLLKGLSLKEVAGARDTTERTARQQALAVYHKAGLAGRAELSAFFLEDLLLPQAGAAGGTSAEAAGGEARAADRPAA